MHMYGSKVLYGLVVELSPNRPSDATGARTVKRGR
jgi:hypothetical protein